MDKSVKDVFRYNDPDSGYDEWYVLSSYVMLQLSNSKKRSYHNTKEYQMQ